MAPCRVTRASTRTVAQPDPTTPAPSGRKRLAGLRAKRSTKPVARKSAAGGPPRNQTSGAGAALKEKEVVVMMVSEGEETEAKTTTAAKDPSGYNVLLPLPCENCLRSIASGKGKDGLDCCVVAAGGREGLLLKHACAGLRAFFKIAQDKELVGPRAQGVSSAAALFPGG
ncbi:hypothetical protein S40288_11663 [Stachybotrys chartarum IBT 40288]|nr:hypothetical protein S40288_11663 [Stachybotrys chartarum IBT 40288]